MGDYSSWVGNRQEFIEGVDELCEREIIDTKDNACSLNNVFHAKVLSDIVFA